MSDEQLVYVLVDANGRITAAARNYEPLVPAWRDGRLSLRMMGPDGKIVPVFDEDYVAANRLAHRKPSETATR